MEHYGVRALEAEVLGIGELGLRIGPSKIRALEVGTSEVQVLVLRTSRGRCRGARIRGMREGAGELGLGALGEGVGVLGLGALGEGVGVLV